mmetsp:Transcript_25048/g.59167  ORF Transcript_25048/g.59167 Transcript_25048/m.59167 type:complete len:250 (-) Transcript_25048:437-1186(-)
MSTFLRLIEHTTQPALSCVPTPLAELREDFNSQAPLSSIDGSQFSTQQMAEWVQMESRAQTCRSFDMATSRSRRFVLGLLLTNEHSRYLGTGIGCRCCTSHENDTPRIRILLGFPVVLENFGTERSGPNFRNVEVALNIAGWKVGNSVLVRQDLLHVAATNIVVRHGWRPHNQRVVSLPIGDGKNLPDMPNAEWLPIVRLGNIPATVPLADVMALRGEYLKACIVAVGNPKAIERIHADRVRHEELARA